MTEILFQVPSYIIDHHHSMTLDLVLLGIGHSVFTFATPDQVTCSVPLSWAWWELPTSLRGLTKTKVVATIKKDQQLVKFCQAT